MIPLRDDQPSSQRPLMTWALIAINVALFLYELMLGERLEPFLMQAAFVPARLFGGGGVHGGDLQVDNALLSMFLHGGWAHIGGNMLFLWIFGDNVEDRFGHVKFLIFYLLCGIAATFAQYYVSPSSNIPNVGASGAIAGVLGAYILMFPQARVNVLFGNQMVAMPALIVLGFWIVLQLFSGVGSIAYTDESTRDMGGVAYMAHVGGFVAGFLMTFLFRGSGGNPRLSA